MTFTRNVLVPAARLDLSTFTQLGFGIVCPTSRYSHNWHIDVVAWHLERCFTGRITKLIITLPPRYLKSICASVVFPAWALGHDPSKRIICASYSLDLATKHARDCRALMDSSMYRRVFPKTLLDPSKSAETEFTTTERGFRLTTSVGGTLTGRGGNIIIIDDPTKASDATSDARRSTAVDWLRNTLLSRLDNKDRDSIIIVTQRLHPDDLVGQLLASDDSWVHLNLPAIATNFERFEDVDGRVFTRKPDEALHPEREPLEVLERIRKAMGRYDFDAQYQQDPMPLTSGMINFDWFKRYEEVPERTEQCMVIQSWDTASKTEEIHDYSVGTTWLLKRDGHFLIDVVRVHLDYPHLKRLMIETAKKFRADAVLIEDRSSGTSLIQDIQQAESIPIIGLAPEGDKVMRMLAQTLEIEAGRVYLPRHAPWLDDLTAELQRFPNGRHDDQVDSISQYLGWARQRLGVVDAPFIIVESQAAADWDAMIGSTRY